MKKKVLFISQKFYPDSSGTITCLTNFLPLLSNKYNLTLYTNRVYVNSPSKEKISNINIKRPRNIFDDFVIIKLKLIRIIGLININVLRNILIFITKVIFFPFQYIAKKTGFIIPEAWENNLYNYIENKENLSNFHAVLAVGSMFSNIRVAYHVKKKNRHLKLILIEFDLYAYNPELLLNDNNIDTFHRRLLEEKKWYKLADYIVVTFEMYKLIIGSELREWKDKVIPVNMPVLLNNNKKSKTVFIDSVGKVIDIIYAGRLYEDIRNPKFVLTIFNEVCKKYPEIRLHFLSKGCEEILRKFKRLMGKNLIIHGYKSKSYTIKAISSANILLNISNKTNFQAPSKIIEYIGFCKPIINIYCLKDDICQKYLKNYYLSISIKEDWSSINNIVDNIYSFIIKHYKDDCGFDTVVKEYGGFLPENFSNQLIELID
jgi:hypothetical protein